MKLCAELSHWEGAREDQQIPTPPFSQSLPTETKNASLPAVILTYSVLAVASVFMVAARYLFPVLAADIRHDLGFSLANAGALSTIFALGVGIGGLPIGYLMSRFSRKAILQAGIAISSVAIGLTARMSAFWSLLLCLACTGIGMAIMTTVLFSFMGARFSRYRGAAVGSVNVCYGLGAIVGPLAAGFLRTSYQSWRVPMISFGLSGLFLVGVLAVSVPSWFSELQAVSQVRSDHGGASTLLNRNSILLTVLSVVHGFAFYGFLGLYPTFLRENLHYSPNTAGFVMSFFGLGGLLSIGGGWLGDRFPPRWILGTGFFCTAAVGYLVFHGSSSVAAQATLTFAYGVIANAIIYVNLAGYHLRSVQTSLGARASGLFVSSMYGSATFAGFLMGALASHGGWTMAGNIQVSLFSIIAAAFVMGLRLDQRPSRESAAESH